MNKRDKLIAKKMRSNFSIKDDLDSRINKSKLIEKVNSNLNEFKDSEIKINNGGREKRSLGRLEKLKEIMVYIWAGFLITINLVLVYFLWNYRSSYFNFAIDFSRTLDFGFLILKLVLLVVVLIIDLKTIKSIIRMWGKVTFKEKLNTKEGIEEYKRMGFLRKLWFYWILYETRSWMDKYHEGYKRLSKRIGKIKGNENKELMKLKKEMIKGILLWTDDFRVTKYKLDKYGQKIPTNEPVDEEFLNSLYLEDLYENYLLECIDGAERFLNGVNDREKLENL